MPGRSKIKIVLQKLALIPFAVIDSTGLIKSPEPVDDPVISSYPFKQLSRPFCRRTEILSSTPIGYFHENMTQHYDAAFLWDKYVIIEVTRKRLRRWNSLFRGKVEFVEVLVCPSPDFKYPEKLDLPPEGLRVVVEIGDSFGYPVGDDCGTEVYRYLDSGGLRAYNTIRIYNERHDKSATPIASLDFGSCSDTSLDTSIAHCTGSSKPQTLRSKQKSGPQPNLQFSEFITLATTVNDLLGCNEENTELTSEISSKFAATLIRALAIHAQADLYEHRQIKDSEAGVIGSVLRRKKRAHVLVDPDPVRRLKQNLVSSNAVDLEKGIEEKGLDVPAICSVLQRFQQSHILFLEGIEECKRNLGVEGTQEEWAEIQRRLEWAYRELRRRGSTIF